MAAAIPEDHPFLKIVHIVRTLVIIRRFYIQNIKVQRATAIKSRGVLCCFANKPRAG